MAKNSRRNRTNGKVGTTVNNEAPKNDVIEINDGDIINIIISSVTIDEQQFNTDIKELEAHKQEIISYILDSFKVNIESYKSIDDYYGAGTVERIKGYDLSKLYETQANIKCFAECIDNDGLFKLLAWLGNKGSINKVIYRYLDGFEKSSIELAKIVNSCIKHLESQQPEAPDHPDEDEYPNYYFVEFGDVQEVYDFKMPIMNIDIYDEEDKHVARFYMSPFRFHHFQISETIEGHNDMGSSPAMEFNNYFGYPDHALYDMIRGQIALALIQFTNVMDVYAERKNEDAYFILPDMGFPYDKNMTETNLSAFITKTIECYRNYK